MNEGLTQEEIGRTVGERLRAAREIARLSRRLLALNAKVSERYLVQLEAGEANVSIGVLTRIATALGAELTDFLPHGKAGSSAAQETKTLAGPLSRILQGMSPREKAGAVPVLEKYLEDRRRSLKGVALLGLRGAGKTTIGGLYAARHGLPLLSVTREIEARAGMSLADLFNLGGPEAYRTLENEVVADFAQRGERMVLETAGGIVTNKEALDVIFGAFKTVWLKASPQEHLDRVITQGDMRPIQGTPKALEHLKQLLALREAEYERADCVIDTSHRTPEECAEELDRIAGPIGRVVVA